MFHKGFSKFIGQQSTLCPLHDGSVVTTSKEHKMTINDLEVMGLNHNQVSLGGRGGGGLYSV